MCLDSSYEFPPRGVDSFGALRAPWSGSNRTSAAAAQLCFPLPGNPKSPGSSGGTTKELVVLVFQTLPFKVAQRLKETEKKCLFSLTSQGMIDLVAGKHDVILRNWLISHP